MLGKIRSRPKDNLKATAKPTTMPLYTFLPPGCLQGPLKKDFSNLFSLSWLNLSENDLLP